MIRVKSLPVASRRSFRIAAAVCFVAFSVTSCRQLGLLAPGAQKPGSAIPAKMFPNQLSGGFLLATPLERYHADDLWKKINGAADLYLSYGFRELLIGGFGKSREGLPELETSIYRMDSALNALGVYLAERSEGADRVEIGWEGYQSGDGLFLHKGSYYIKIVDLSEEASLGNLAREVARHVEGLIRVERKNVAEMEVFPPSGLNADSILYVHQDALGHGYLRRVFKAEYTMGDNTATLFFCRHKNAAELLARHRAYAKDFGRIEREWEDGGLQLLLLRAFESPELVFARGDVFGGVMGCPDTSASLRLIRALLANLDGQSGP